MEKFDYDELKSLKTSKFIVNYDLIRRKEEKTVPIKFPKFHILKPECTIDRSNNKVQLEKPSSFIDSVRKRQKTESINEFEEITAHLRSNFMSKLPPKAKTRNRSSQTKTTSLSLTTTSLRDRNSILKIRNQTTKTVYVNLLNGFTSFHTNEVIEDKKRILNLVEETADDETRRFTIANSLKIETCIRTGTLEEKVSLFERFKTNYSSDGYLKLSSDLSNEWTEIGCELKHLNKINIGKYLFEELKVGFF